MAKSRRYSIEVKDAQSKTILVSAAVEWTSDEKQIAVAHIFRLPGVAGLCDHAADIDDRHRGYCDRGAVDVGHALQS